MPTTGGPAADTQSFALRDCALIAIATGRKAQNLREMADILSGVSEDCIYHHVWGGLLEPRFEEREFNNDFAAWARHGLHDGVLAERLAMVNPSDAGTLEDLRQEFLDIIEERLDESEYLHWSRATEQIEFLRSQIVVFDTGRVATDPAQLARVLPDLSAGSVFYHFVDARRRHPDQRDDFSTWLVDLGPEHQAIVERLATIDPYFTSLTELRRRIAEAFAPLPGSGHP